jgi:cardiolipin synthase (CMP-forming)
MTAGDTRTGAGPENTKMPMLSISQLPNLITIFRIALVPVLILLLKDQEYAMALVVFAVAGVSDGLDGFIAKRFHCETRLGSILDPAADKTLLVSSYVMLMVLNHVPFWLMLVYTSMVGPVQMRPSWLSKLNTFMQIALIVVILAQQAMQLIYPLVVDVLIYAVLLTTVASGLHYLWTWLVMKDLEPVKQHHD